MTVVEFNNNDDDFHSNTTKIKDCLKQNTVVLVFAVWCPHCTMMKEDWRLLKEDMGNKVNVVEIESSNLDRIRSQDKELYKKLFPQEEKVFFPMIKMFKNNKAKVYEEERKFHTMKHHINKHYLTKTRKKPKVAKKPKVIPKKQRGGATENNAKKEEVTKIKKLQLDLNKFVENLIKQTKLKEKVLAKKK
jgi:thiol-disulfide isomerase/thioredoxin